MARDFLGEFGPESKPGGNRATTGGVKQAHPLSYSPPKGPTNINDPQGPGLHGHNCGNTNQPRTSSPGGSPGLHGTNKGTSGSQR